MSTSRVAHNLKFVSRLLSEEGLTKKASLNALAAALDYGARLLVGFLVTPLLVAGLGAFYYGAWQVLLRLVGYISPASGRPTQALKWSLANQQASSDYEHKHRLVGSTLAVWALFLPVLTILGALLAWFVPYWIGAPAESFWSIRLAAGILVGNLALGSLVAVPQSVLEGENLGYKRMGLSALLVCVGGGLMWLALYLQLGIAGVAAATVATTMLTGVFFLQVARANVPWLAVARPSREAFRPFLGLSWWFLVWNLIMKLMLAGDVVVLGTLDSVESVTAYALTKYAPETLISIVAIMVFGMTPGLGGLIGSGQIKKAAMVRSEIMSLTWLIATVLGTTVLLWNRTFLRFWVGEEYYLGAVSSLLIVVMITQFVLIRNDASIIDLTLRLRRKVLMGGLSVALSLVAAGVLVGFFRLGVVGLCLGIMAGRLILSIGYPALVGRFLNVSPSAQLRGALRPALVTLLFFWLAMELDGLSSASNGLAVTGWIGLVLAVAVTSSVALLLAFLAGLSVNQQRAIMRRLRVIIAQTPG